MQEQSTCISISRERQAIRYQYLGTHVSVLVVRSVYSSEYRGAWHKTKLGLLTK